MLFASPYLVVIRNFFCIYRLKKGPGIGVLLCGGQYTRQKIVNCFSRGTKFCFRLILELLKKNGEEGRKEPQIKRKEGGQEPNNKSVSLIKCRTLCKAKVRT